MSPKDGRIRNVSLSEAESYLNKAKEFYLAMLDNYQSKRWNATGFAGIHCAISSSDAVLGKIANIRSASSDHYDTVLLLRKYLKGAGRGRAEEQVTRLSRVLGQKNLVEYESRDFRQDECEKLVKDVGRFFEYAKEFFL